MTLRFFFLSVAACLFFSCSMKEDIQDCPCHLTVGLEQASDNSSVHISLFAGEVMLADSVITPGEYTDGYGQDVPRVSILVNVLQGLSENRLEGRNVIIEEGGGADRIFYGRKTVDCNAERVYTAAEFHKNWAEVEIEASGYGLNGHNYGFTVTGDICGFEMTSGKPVSGTFRCLASPSANGNGLWSLNLPRQYSDGGRLTLTVTDSDENREVLTCSLTQLLRKTGYDWEKSDLDDILLNFDGAELSAGIKVSEWNDGKDSQITI